MLFFDGPLFALYKSKKRPLLNTSSKTGEVVIEFEHEGIQYCILRQLQKTSSWESVKSRLWTKEFEGVTSQEHIVSFDKEQDFVPSADYEPFSFKNESDLQDILASVLPPQEVMEATFFLMQDSDNVFELPPQQRLEIFKNIFWLLDIDEMKERVAEHKRDLSTKIRILKDTSSYDQKFTTSLSGLIWKAHSFLSLVEGYGLSQHYEYLQAFVQDQELLPWKILIENFTLPSVVDKELVEQQFDKALERFHTLQTQQELLKQSQTHRSEQLNALNVKMRALVQKQSQHKQELAGLDNTKLSNLTNSLEEIEKNIDALRTSEDAQQFLLLLEKLSQELSQDQSYRKLVKQENSDNISLGQAKDVVQSLVALGKEYRHQEELLQEQQKSLKLQEKTLQENVAKTQEALVRFEKTHSLQEQELRDKLADCPCAKDILADRSLKTQDDYIQALQKTYRDAQDELKTFQSQHSIRSDNTSSVYLKSLGATLSAMQRKDILDREQSLQSLQQALQDKTKQYKIFEEQLQNKKLIEQSLQDLAKQLEDYQQEHQELHKSYLDEEQRILTLDKDLAAHKTKQDIQQDQKLVEGFYIDYASLQDLLISYKEQLLHTKTLQEQENIVKNLYDIFSKELLLMVVGANLPKIQDLMNAYLAQVVDYELRMDVDKKSLRSDKIELLVTIHDELGERQVESLSGGQKVILKLVWMIAISFVSGAPMLFLDETINNMDSDTVSKVAEILTNFTTQKWSSFQFYVVSHDQQIQNLDIRDQILDIRRLQE